MKEQFRFQRFHPASLTRIQLANEILEEYGAQGYKLTLRQLYYKFVARNLVPNNQREYKKLGELVNDARLAGLIDWDAIVDHTRTLRGVNTWDSPADIIRSTGYSYARDLWASQKYHIEVWIEKDAAVSIVAPACNKYRVDYFSCRGYTGQSAMYGAGKRLLNYVEAGKEPVVLHFGDHDPSGIDMTRDITDRLTEFARQKVTIVRCALTFPQVQQYKCPPNPAKESDSRCEAYVAEYGQESWELDALEPNVITSLITAEVEARRDMKQWRIDFAQEESEIRDLEKCYRNWSKVQKFLGKIRD
jgi:hypothetical protein